MSTLQATGAQRVAKLVCGVLAVVHIACGSAGPDVLTFSGSALGREGAIVRRHLARFAAMQPGLVVEVRPTPDAADERRQLYVQWLNARAPEPDVLQLDIIWTPEFAAAGWIRSLEPFNPPVADFFPAGIEANRWGGRLFALPWFVDVGMLYWRTDLLAGPPQTFDELDAAARRARQEAGLPYGFVWQGSRYEGLVTVFLEHLGGFGGRIVDDRGRVVVDAEPAVRALTYMRDAIYARDVVPPAVLAWQEEQSRFAFQNGQAAFMRNWPYAYPLMQDRAASRVAGRFGVAPMPATPDGTTTATLGGSQLAINAQSRQPDAAYALITFLTAPEQMLERARDVGQYPTRAALFDTTALAHALPVPLDEVRRVIESATPRPVSPVYAEMSDILQIRLHRVLTRQQEPRPALEDAARAIQNLLAEAGLAEGS